MYHGSPEDRAELRRTPMALSRKHETLPKKKHPTQTKKRRITKHHDSDDEVEDDVEDEENPTTQKSSFPVVVTTYEMIIKDRKHLAKHDWGHRLKNMDSILTREIKKYPSAGRLLLTGTALRCITSWRSSGLSLPLSCLKFLCRYLPRLVGVCLSYHTVNFSF
ncbi:hypothetical protein V8E53_009895 [Lactarius tabidus]